jgi:hypothetical protein
MGRTFSFSRRDAQHVDVAIDPYLNIFTRDNTNDGGGWWSRVMHMQRDGEYGYPHLYVNFADEIIAAMVIMVGSARVGVRAGAGFPRARASGRLFVCVRLGRGILYRHDLAPRGRRFRCRRMNS